MLRRYAAGGYLDTIQPALDRWFSPEFEATHPGVVEAVRERMENNDADVYANAYEVFATGDAELVDQVHRIVAPTLVITGEHDQRSTPAMARALAAAIPGATAVVIPAARHLLPLERPHELARVVGWS